MKQKTVQRKRLFEKLERGFDGRIILVSAPAGFGKTTLISDWIEECRQPAAWLSIDKDDNDPVIFMIYLIAALRTIDTRIGETIIATLQSTDSPDFRTVLARIINDLSALEDDSLLVIDDYHLIASQKVHDIFMFFIEHLPPNMYVIISTRERLPLNLVRFRASGQLLDISAKDLRFSLTETEEFFSKVMGANITRENIIKFEQQIEGWIAGLKLAAISMNENDAVESFSDHFPSSKLHIMDYLVQEVLKRQSAEIQRFLLVISILDRFCASLCDAVLGPLSVSGKKTLELVKKKNLFIIPIDEQRKWYRYHHLFKEALYKKLQETAADSGPGLKELHSRASAWFEKNQLVPEALHHAVMAGEYESASRLLSGGKIQLHNKSSISSIINILNSLPQEVFFAFPELQIELAALTLAMGNTEGVEENLTRAERTLLKRPATVDNKNHLGRIAVARSTLAFTEYRVSEIIKQSEIALELLDDESISPRATAFWTKANALELTERYKDAGICYDKAHDLCKKTANTFLLGICMIGKARMREYANDLYGAEKLYSRVISLFEHHLIPVVGEAYIGLTRIYYQWNDLDTAYEKVRKSLELTKLYEDKLDRYIISEVLMAEVLLALDETDKAEEILENTASNVRQNNFRTRFPEVVSARVQVFLRKGFIDEAERIIEEYDQPLAAIKVLLFKGHAGKALISLEQLKKKMIELDLKCELLKIKILEAEAMSMNGDIDQALKILTEAIMMAEPGGFIRLFTDEGKAMQSLLLDLREQRSHFKYLDRIIESFEKNPEHPEDMGDRFSDNMIEPLTFREQQILKLIAEGFSNHQIASALHLALDTVKGHNRNIFGKLQADRRTEAVARARKLGLL